MTPPDTTQAGGALPLPKVTATWTVELNAECPHCKGWVDVLETPDFWDGRDMEIAEHGTPNSKNVEVVCPDCSKEFAVDCEY